MSSRPIVVADMSSEQSAIRPVVRKARPADAPHISRIHNQSIASNSVTMRESPASASEALALIQEEAGKRSAVLVITLNEVVCGWGRVWPYSAREGYRFAGETALFIDRSLQGRGLGTTLQAALVEESIRMGYHYLAAKIMADNSASIHVHVKLGYAVVGIQHEIGHKNGSWTNVAILEYVCDRPQ